jgi:hypothetical protein
VNQAASPPACSSQSRFADGHTGILHGQDQVLVVIGIKRRKQIPGVALKGHVKVMMLEIVFDGLTKKNGPVNVLKVILSSQVFHHDFLSIA